MKITFGVISNYLKIGGDIRRSRRTTRINDSDGKLSTSTAGVAVIGGKFATAVNISENFEKIRNSPDGTWERLIYEKI
jgi:hypothetical protein